MHNNVSPKMHFFFWEGDYSLKNIFAVEVSTVSENCLGCGHTEYIHSTNSFVEHDNFMSCFSF